MHERRSREPSNGTRTKPGPNPSLNQDRVARAGPNRYGADSMDLGFDQAGLGAPWTNWIGPNRSWTRSGLLPIGRLGDLQLNEDWIYLRGSILRGNREIHL